MRSHPIATLVLCLTLPVAIAQADEDGGWVERGGRDGVKLAIRERQGSKIREIRAIAGLR